MFSFSVLLWTILVEITIWTIGGYRQMKSEFEKCVHCQTDIVTQYFITHLVKCLLETLNPKKLVRSEPKKRK